MRFFFSLILKLFFFFLIFLSVLLALSFFSPFALCMNEGDIIVTVTDFSNVKDFGNFSNHQEFLESLIKLFEVLANGNNPYNPTFAAHLINDQANLNNNQVLNRVLADWLNQGHGGNGEGPHNPNINFLDRNLAEFHRIWAELFFLDLIRQNVPQLHDPAVALNFLKIPTNMEFIWNKILSRPDFVPVCDVLKNANLAIDPLDPRLNRENGPVIQLAKYFYTSYIQNKGLFLGGAHQIVLTPSLDSITSAAQTEIGNYVLSGKFIDHFKAIHEFFIKGGFLQKIFN